MTESDLQYESAFAVITTRRKLSCVPINRQRGKGKRGEKSVNQNKAEIKAATTRPTFILLIMDMQEEKVWHPMEPVFHLFRLGLCAGWLYEDQQKNDEKKVLL